jgi:hypothetical protein
MKLRTSVVALHLACAIPLAACDRGGEPSVVEEAAAAAARGIDRASSERTINRLEGLRLALERHAADHGGYPPGSSLGAIRTDLAPYLAPLQESDAWGGVMSYQSDGRTYTIVSAGPDGRSGTQDDIVMTDGAISPGAP